MISAIREFLKYPEFGDYEENQQGKFIHVSLLVIAVASTFLGIHNLGGQTNLEMVLFVLGFISLLCVPISKQGYYRFTAVLVAILILAAITYSLVVGVGLKDAGLIAYPPFIVYTSFLFRKRGAFYATISSIASVVLVYYLDQMGYLNPAEFTNQAQMRVILILLIAIGAFLWTIMDNWERMLDVLRSEIEERRNAEKRIRKLNRELEQLVLDRTKQLEATNKELEAFSYSVSHDLRAPLRAINGFSQIILDDYSDKITPEVEVRLNRIRSASQQMGVLIEDLLKLSRVTRQAMDRKLVDMSEMAGDIVAELKETQPERIIQISITPGLICSADRRLLRVVLRNLIENAWKFTGKQKQTKIEFGVVQKNNQTTYFVRDNGCGFDMEYAENLFKPFQRLHSSEEFEGTGIGLVTVQRIIHRHDGQIWVEAQPDVGATFFFTLGE